MMKSAAFVLPALVLAALPVAAQSQTAKPAQAAKPARAAAASPAAAAPGVPGPNFKIDDLGCTVRLSYFKNISVKRASDPAVSPELQAQARNGAIQSDIALTYYLGRLSLAAADPYRAQRGAAIFAAMKTASPQQNAAETQVCGSNAMAQSRAAIETLTVK